MTMMNTEAAQALGFGSVGQNVQISAKASFYGLSRIHIGNNVRIDDFTVFSAGDGGIEIGNNIHIAVFSSLIGAGKIRLFDFCNISSRVSIYSSNDDYSGETMTNPTIPKSLSRVEHAPVTICKHVIIGAGSVILPGVTLHEGVAIGALSLVTKSCDEFGIYCGVPARRIKERKRDLLELEKSLLVSSGFNP
jgi:dTDP-4-amino-4,6-dideoxy-D-glucose acyltransferase